MIDLSIDGGIAQVTLCHTPVNALSPQLLQELDDALRKLSALDTWQVLVICSDQRVFSAGGDLETMRTWMFDGTDGGQKVADYSHQVQRLCDRIEQLDRITVAACAGSAIGGGLELALSCDLRIASDKAKFGLPEVSLGLMPAAGGTQRLTRLCGAGTAARMIYTAEIVDAQQAYDWGLVQWLLPAAHFDEQSKPHLQRLASLPKRALSNVKACVKLAHTTSGAKGFELEITGAAQLAASEETQKLVSAFLDGRRA